MTPRALTVPSACVVFLFSAAAVGVGQTLASPQVPPAVYVRIDDQLLDVGDQLSLPSGASKPQGATLDSNSFGWRFKFNGWDSGVVPIEFALTVGSYRVAT